MINQIISIESDQQLSNLIIYVYIINEKQSNTSSTYSNQHIISLTIDQLLLLPKPIDTPQKS
jgi:hypothetical protein